MGMCRTCGANAGFMFEICSSCIQAQDRARDAEVADPGQIEKEREYAAAIAAIQLTTAPTLEGHTLVRTIDIIAAECVYGMNLLRDAFAAFTDVLGGRSAVSQQVLRDARQVCLRELREEAHRVGANAVIAVDLDYSEFSGGGKSMLFLVASGTAVVVERVESGRELSL